MKAKKKQAVVHRKQAGFEFTLVLAESRPRSARAPKAWLKTKDAHRLREIEDALFRAGCDDATLSLRYGRYWLHFTRKAASMKAAILSALRDVNKAKLPLAVLRVDVHPMVTQADIARQLGRSRQSVHQYITGARGPGGFPAPVCDLRDGSPLWSWVEVAQWLWQNELIQEQAACEAKEVAAINSVLEWLHQCRMEPALIDLIWKQLKKETALQS